MTLKFRLPARRPLWSNKRGNIAIITALMMIPLTFAMGMAYDYTMAESRQDQINGMADVATLAGVTPTEMGGSWSNAQNYSANLFASQIATVNGVVSMTPVWTGNDNSSGASVTRTLTINYTAGSQNVFASLLGMPTFPLKGSSTATSSTAPNIDFYLLMDTSPSMEIAATTTGIATMQANTSDGCAFACHQTDTSGMTGLNSSGQLVKCTTSGHYSNGVAFTAWAPGDALTPPYVFPPLYDSYDLSRCTGVVLRIDLLNTAAQNLMDTASTTAANDHAAYRMAIYETDVNQVNPANDLNLYTLQMLTSNLATAKTQAATIVSLEMCRNNQLVCGDSNGDMDTFLDPDLTTLNTNLSLLPTPGNGTNNVGDTPQEVLFIVTDALNDETPSRQYPPIDWSDARCSAIKSRGIRIAVLYTQYVAGSGGSWYTGHVQPGLPTGIPAGLPSTTPNAGDPMALAAQQCASPGLYYMVSTDGDVSAALTHLFQEAVASARLLH